MTGVTRWRDDNMGAEMLSERRRTRAAYNGASDVPEQRTQEAETTRRHVCTQEHTGHTKGQETNAVFIQDTIFIIDCLIYNLLFTFHMLMSEAL